MPSRRSYRDDRGLPRSARTTAAALPQARFLAEAEAHLRDSVARHQQSGLSRAEAEAAAVADFGEAAAVGRRFAAEVAVVETRIAPVVALAATAFFVFPLYVVPENTLPPAPWLEKPRDIHIVQQVAIGLWIAAGALAAMAALLAWTRWRRLVTPALLGAGAALLGSSLTTVVLVVRWFSYTPATPNWAFAAPLALGCLLACGFASGWAHRRRFLVPD